MTFAGCCAEKQSRMSECKIKILGVSEKERDSALWDEILQFVGVWQFRRSIVLRPRELCERIREMAKIHPLFYAIVEDITKVLI